MNDRQVKRWQRSSYSGSGNNCVEAAALHGVVAVRDSKDPQGPGLAFTPDAWETFTRRIKAGDLDLP